jgi:hypothetical protein
VQPDGRSAADARAARAHPGSCPSGLTAEEGRGSGVDKELHGAGRTGPAGRASTRLRLVRTGRRPTRQPSASVSFSTHWSSKVGSDS